MGRKSTGNTEFCPEPAKSAGRRKRLPENHSSERRRTLRNRGSVKRYPSHWSDAQKRARADLRKWERLPVINEREKFPVKLLVNQASEGRLEPYMLPALFALGPQLALMLGCVAKACLHQRSKAVSGSREWWGRLLGCGGTKAYEYLRAACDQHFLERLPQFKPHSGRGRDGERIDNRQIDSCYRPGLRLKSVWNAYHNELANRRRVRSGGPRSTADATRQPSLRSKSFSNSMQHASKLSPPSLAGKVPPAAASIDSPPGAAQVFRQATGDEMSVDDRKVSARVYSARTADPGSPSQSASRADSSRARYGARLSRPISDEEKRCLDAGAIDIGHARDLWKLARPDDRPSWVPPGDSEAREMALTIARVTAKMLGAADD